MRNDLIESVLIGGSVGLLAIIIHIWTDAAATATQVLALLAAGFGLAGFQLALAYRRSRRPGRAPDGPGSSDQPPARRNQFMRELTSDWTGLEDSPQPPAAPEAEPPEPHVRPPKP